MKHKLKTAPATEPVTLAEMRAHIGIVQAADTARNANITNRIKAAREMVEELTRISLITQTWTGYAADFPAGKIELRGPVISVTHIKYYDTDGVLQTLDSSKYIVQVFSDCVELAYGESWPDVRCQLNAVQVEYITGFGAAADVPESLKEAIRFIVSQWEVFQSSMEGVMRPFTIPHAAEQLLLGKIDMRDWF